MSTWNYRVLYSKEHDEEYFAIHEVYYDDDGNKNGYVETPAVVISDHATGMIDMIKMFSAALEKPIIDKANFPQEYKFKPKEESTIIKSIKMGVEAYKMIPSKKPRIK